MALFNMDFMPIFLIDASKRVFIFWNTKDTDILVDYC